MDVTAERVCPQCAELVESPEDRFCEACGQNLDVVVAGTTSADEPAPEPCAACGSGTPLVPGEFCDECGMGRTEPRIVLDLDGPAGVSDRGLVHERNEDAIAFGRARDGRLAAVVCDGVSSTVHPERASRAAADTALEVLLAPGASGGEERMREAVKAAAAAVDAFGGGYTGPSCTLVAGYVEPGAVLTVTVGWVGDSRAYWLDDGAGPAAYADHVLTEDHSWAAEMIAAGLADADEVANDPRAHAITRWLGPGEDPEQTAADVVTLHPSSPGTLLLCSDGLWNDVPEAERLGEVVRRAASPVAAAQELTGLALDAGGRDNISVVVVPVRPDTLDIATDEVGGVA